MTATSPALTKTRRGIKLKSGDTVTQFPAQPESSNSLRTVSVDAIVVDQRLQFRADGLDADYVADLAQVYVDNPGAIFPITLYEFAGVLTLADGFHRHAAMVAAGVSEVRAIVIEGDRRAAMCYALRANTTHGKRRTLDDAVYAYRRAIAESLVEPGDVQAVSRLLGISDRWAREITKEARDRANAERDATIQRLAQEGQTQRQIAEQVGMTQPGVKRVLDNKRKSSESYQTDPDKAASLDFQAPAPLLDLQPSAPDAESVALQAAKRAYLALRGPDLARFRDWVALQGKGASS